MLSDLWSLTLATVEASAEAPSPIGQVITSIANSLKCFLIPTPSVAKELMPGDIVILQPLSSCVFLDFGNKNHHRPQTRGAIFLHWLNPNQQCLIYFLDRFWHRLKPLRQPNWLLLRPHTPGSALEIYQIFSQKWPQSWCFLNALRVPKSQFLGVHMSDSSSTGKQPTFYSTMVPKWTQNLVKWVSIFSTFLMLFWNPVFNDFVSQTVPKWYPKMCLFWDLRPC